MPISTRTFRVFLSSTFEVLAEERNALQRDVFPVLERVCEARGARFQAVDLRWGVRDEAALDQQTMQVCLAEIDRCQQTGIKPNFVVLLGSRYGWRPLPAHVDAREFETVRAYISDERDQAAVDHWYRRDVNAVPPVYLLKPRIGRFAHPSHWLAMENQLRAALSNAAAAAGLSPEARLKYEASATHQEILKGLGHSSEDRKHVFAFCRSGGETTEDPALSRLKTFLREQLGGNVSHYDAGDLATLCSKVRQSLESVIIEESSRFQTRTLLDLETEAHERFAVDRARLFVGRLAEVEAINEYIGGADFRPLLLHGSSGSGKSAIMARTSSLAVERYPNAVIVRRFIGASPDSSNGVTLLRSVCEQIAREYEAPDETPSSYQELAAAFRDRLALARPDRPLIVFLDALDQLEQHDLAATLTWLPRELSPHSRVVVSMIEVPNVFRNLRRISVASLAPRDVDDALSLWLNDAARTLQPLQRDKLLASVRRSGLPLYVRFAFEEARRWRSFDPEDACVLGDGLAEMMDLLLQRLSAEQNHGLVFVLRSLGYLTAARYGLTEDEILDVLSNDEVIMDDLRSRGYHQPPERQLPVIVWSRLSLDLEPYLTERSAPGGIVINFYHRQLAEHFRSTWSPEHGVHKSPHGVLARYFAAQPSSVVDDQSTNRNRRRTGELPFQLAMAGLDDELIELLTNLSFLRDKTACGDVFDLCEDLDRAMKAIGDVPRRGRLRSVEQAIQRDLHFLSDHPSALFQCLINHVQWGEPDLIDRWLAEQKENDPAHLWIRLLQPTIGQVDQGQRSTWRGHTGGITCMVISSDGRVVASGGDHSDRCIRVWEASTGRQLACLEGHEQAVTSVALSRDATILVSASEDGSLRVWDVGTAQPLTKLIEHGRSTPKYICPVYGVALLPDEQRIASVGGDGMVLITSLEARSDQALAGHEGPVYCVTVSPDGRWVVSGGADATIRVWNATTGEALRIIRGHAGAVTCLGISRDGAYIVSGSADNTVRIWTLPDGHAHACLQNHGDTVTSVLFRDHMASLVSASNDGTVRGWNFDTGQEVFCIHGHSREVTCLAADSGTAIYSGSADGTLCVWDSDASTQRTYFESTHKRVITHVRLSPNGTRVASASQDGAVLLSDATTGRPLQRFAGHADELIDILFCGEEVLITAGKDGKVCIWREAQPEPEFRLPAPSAEIQGLNLIADRRRILCWGPGHVRMWDIDTGREAAPLTAPSGGVSALAVDPGGRLMAIGTNQGSIVILETETGSIQMRLEGHARTKIRSRNRGSVISFGDGTERVVPEYSTSTAVVRCLSFSEDGRRLASGSNDCSARVWDAVEGREIACMRTESDPIEEVRFFKEGRLILTLSHSDMFVLWDATTGKRLNFDAVYDPESQEFLSIMETTRSKAGSRLAAFVRQPPREGAQGFIELMIGLIHHRPVEGFSCVWDVGEDNLVMIERVDGRADLASLAEGAEAYPLSALAARGHTRIRDSARDQVLATWPVYLTHLTALTDRRTFVGACDNELHWIRLCSA